jgi:hypothetical protein
MTNALIVSIYGQLVALTLELDKAITEKLDSRGFLPLSVPLSCLVPSKPLGHRVPNNPRGDFGRPFSFQEIQPCMHPSHLLSFSMRLSTTALSTLCGACALQAQFVLKSGKPQKAT